MSVGWMIVVFALGATLLVVGGICLGYLIADANNAERNVKLAAAIESERELLGEERRRMIDTMQALQQRFAERERGLK